MFRGEQLNFRRRLAKTSRRMKAKSASLASEYEYTSLNIGLTYAAACRGFKAPLRKVGGLCCCGKYKL